MTSAALEAIGLAAGYNRNAVVRGIDLSIQPGEILALLGPNGAGKTTTLLTLAGVFPAIAGEVRMHGRPTRAPLHFRVRSGLALVTSDRTIVRGLTVAENIRLGRGAAADVLRLFPELTPLLGRTTALLSGGEQQMLALGMALAMRPKVLLADEISLGLAPLVVQRLMSAVEAGRRFGNCRPPRRAARAACPAGGEPRDRAQPRQRRRRRLSRRSPQGFVSNRARLPACRGKSQRGSFARATLTRPVVEIVGALCTVELAEPEKRNRLSVDVLKVLEDVTASLRLNASVRVLLIRGQGSSFSAGADLRQWPSPAEPWQSQRVRRSRWQRLLDDIEALPQISIARLHGSVVGGAVLLALSCDLRIASDDVTIRIPELALGIPLTWGGIPRLAREIGLPRARDMVLTGRTVDADEALAWGLVTRVAPPDHLDSGVGDLIDSVLESPPAIGSMTRQAMAAIGLQRMSATGWADVDLYLSALDREEAREARERYIAKLTSRREGGR